MVFDFKFFSDVLKARLTGRALPYPFALAPSGQL
jgi:hypothetical protein